MVRLIFILAAAACFVSACSSSKPEEIITLENEGTRLLYHEGGWLEIEDGEENDILVHAVAVVILDSLSPMGPQLATDADRERTIEQKQETDALGEAQRLLVTMHGEDAEPDIIWRISAYPYGGFYTFRVTVDNTTDQPVDVAKIAALRVVSDTEGSLFLGRDPSTHRILDNGSLTILDYMVEVHPGDVERDDALARTFPGAFGGASAATWNHAVVDLAGDSTWVAGGLTFERSIPVLNLSFVPHATLESEDGRRGFAFFSAEAAYLPEPKPVQPGKQLDSELYYVHPSEPDVLAGLERYAERLAAYLDIVPWTKRNGGQRVPNGWNSWSGSGSTGGYGTDINEELMLENLEVMAVEFRDWGMDWFQIDDGYEPTYGDWWWREDRFPNGAAWLADQIRDRGLRPGLWMAPFTPSPTSQLAMDHPDWIADWTPIGDVLGGDDLILDLTHPEVQEYLHELFDMFRNEWGYEWFKMDFAYWALLGTGFHDPAMTREEAWHEAVGIIREELGPDTFFLTVSASGLNYQHVDSVRITLDSMPIWDWQPEAGPRNHMTQQGLKPTVRNAGRRWYLQDRVWVNHPDLIFFRSNLNDDGWPPVTLDESRAFCTFVALSGGIVKLGDRLVDLDEDAINTIRTLLPIYGRAARPLDVFTREFPEVWHMSVEPLDGYEESYELFGLFNWGRNWDMSTNPYTEIADSDDSIEHELDLDAMGLEGEWLAYEFWNREFLGKVSGTLKKTIPSHTARVVALRRPTGVPQFLGWNRQITMGGTLIEEVSWDGSGKKLELHTRVAAPSVKAPFTYELAFYVPDGFTFSSVDSSGVALQDLEGARDGDVLRVTFIPETTGDLELAIEFQ